MYGIEELFKEYESDENIQLLKAFTEVVLRGDKTHLGALLEINYDFNAADALMSYWLDTAENVDLVEFIMNETSNDFMENVFYWMQDFETDTFNDHFSRGQMQSKIWLIETLRQCISNGRLGNVALYGGWHATINHMLNEHFDIKRTYNLELEPECIHSSTEFNRAFDFTATLTDVATLEWQDGALCVPDIGRASVNCVINTSCEHMNEDWFNNLPDGQFVVLQTNDFFSCDQHINCVASLDDALAKYKMTDVIYSGELDATVYNRFMIVGIK